MKIKKYFLYQNYKFAYLKFRKKIKVILLLRKNFEFCELTYLEINNEGLIDNTSIEEIKNYSIFDTKIDLNNVLWHYDEKSNFTYPTLRIDRMNLSKHFDKDIDFLVPWVKSRFHFFVLLGFNYYKTQDYKFYIKFKNLVKDWESKNPFLYGVHWMAPMDIAIGSVNLLFAISLMQHEVECNKDFKKDLSEQLIMRAEYLNKFIEIYENNHTTNHTTTEYASLFFLSISLRKHPDSDIWLNKSVSGVIECMKYQVNEDGGDFESSIFYHRLVVEIFGLFTVFSLSLKKNIPNWFLVKLFKMFEFVAAYMDQNGNSTKFGDSDSGRFLVMDGIIDPDFYENDNNHSYLLQLGEKIFNHEFKDSYKDKFEFGNILPKVNRINLDDLGIRTRNVNRSIAFEKTGLYILKNNYSTLNVACFPMGQNGKGGHNHYDMGSYSYSINGEPIIVDPGELSYTRDKKQRTKFRSFTYHNTLSNSYDEKNYKYENTEPYKWWGIRELYKCNVDFINNNKLHLIVKRINDPYNRNREFEFIDNSLTIRDSYNGVFTSRLNLSPQIEIEIIEKSSITTNYCKISFENSQDISINDYEFAPYYGKSVLSKYLLVTASDNLKTTIK